MFPERNKYGTSKENNSNCELGELNEYYYKNRDLRLLLDLLSEASDVATSLRILALFDHTFRQKCKPGNLKFANPRYYNTKTEDNIANEHDVQEKFQTTNAFDIELNFVDAPMMNEIFFDMDTVTCIYTVEIILPPKTICIIPIKVPLSQ